MRNDFVSSRLCSRDTARARRTRNVPSLLAAYNATSIASRSAPFGTAMSETRSRGRIAVDHQAGELAFAVVREICLRQLVVGLSDARCIRPGNFRRARLTRG